MTFDEWWSAQEDDSQEIYDTARAAWQAATLAEREACLRAIDEIEDCGCGVPCDCLGLSDATFAIRARGEGLDSP